MCCVGRLQCNEDEEGESAASPPLAPQQPVAVGDAGAVTISELLAMGADEAWQLVTSLLDGGPVLRPTAVHAKFDDSPAHSQAHSQSHSHLATSSSPPAKATHAPASRARVQAVDRRAFVFDNNFDEL